MLTLKEKLKEATSKKNDAAQEEEDQMNESDHLLKPDTKPLREEKSTGHMIKTVTRQSIKFGAQR